MQASTPVGIGKIPKRKLTRIIIIPDLDFFLESKDVPDYTYSKTIDEARYSPFVILDTSGSTGLPQPISVNHGTLTGFDAQ